MAKVLTTDSSVTCGHKGKVRTEGAKLLKVNGKPVLLESGVVRKAIPGPPDPDACTTVEDTSKGTKKCGSVQSLMAGQAKKLTVKGSPVLLDTLKGTTDGTPPGTLEVSVEHEKLTAV
jgi:hypothetical protein